MTRDETKQILMAIRTVYGSRFEATSELLDIWSLILGEHPYDEAQQALRVFLSNDSKFPPVPGEINQIILKRSAKQTPLAVEVWDACVSLAQKGGDSDKAQKLFATNQNALRAIRAVGWDRIRYGDLETDLPFIRKDFMAYYDQMAEQDSDRKLLMTDRKAAALLKEINVRVKALAEAKEA